MPLSYKNNLKFVEKIEVMNSAIGSNFCHKLFFNFLIRTST